MSQHQQIAVRAAERIVDDQYLRDLIAWGGPAQIRCSEGYLVEDAVVKAMGTHAILLALPDGEHEELIFKHAIEAVSRMSEA